MKHLAALVLISAFLVACTPQEVVAERPQLLVTPHSSASTTWMLALTRGKIVTKNGCVALRVSQGQTYSLVFPPAYTLRLVDGTWQVVDSLGGVVGSMGDYLEVSGGESKTVPSGVSPQCSAPYWVVTPKNRIELVPPGKRASLSPG